MIYDKAKVKNFSPFQTLLTPSNHHGKIKTIALPILCFSLTLFLFAPFSIYLANSYEFTIDAYYLLICGLLLSLIVSFILLLLMLTFPSQSKLQRLALTIISATTFLLFLQGNFIFWEYGPLDGSEIRWQGHGLEAIIDSALWLCILSLTVAKSNWILRYANKLASILLVIQTISFLFLLASCPITPSFKRYVIDESTKFEFSKKRNVIILVLDSFQTDFFQEILKENNFYNEVFDGFTYFRNGMAGYPFTETSTMNMLTGRFYEGVDTFENHNRMSYLDKSIPKILKGKGFEVDVFPLLKRSLYFDETLVSNIVPGRLSSRETIINFANLIDLSFFRYFPTLLKFQVYKNGDWLLTKRARDLMVDLEELPAGMKNVVHGNSLKLEALKESQSLQFLNQMISMSTANKETAVFKFYHLDLPHLPLRINEFLEYEKMPVTRTNFKRQCIAALKIVNSILGNLKKINAYDNSLILIVADHGAGAQKQKFLDTVGFHVPQDEKVVSDWQMVNAIPLFLAKQFNSRGVLRSSNAAVSLSDIPATVFSELGIPTKVQGSSVFEVSETDRRVRRYIFYEKYNPVSDRYDSIQEWVVNGNVWLLSSWQPSNRTFTNNGPVLNSPITYKLGEVIHFDKTASSRQYQTHGWDDSEGNVSGFCWTVGSNAALSFPIKLPQTNLLLTVEALPYLAYGKRTSQRVFVNVNNLNVGEWNVFQKGIYRLIIPKESIKQDFLEISFELLDAISPHEAAGISDNRKLGIGVQTVSLQTISTYELGTILDFRLNGNSKSYVVSGWSEPSSQFTWTVSKTAIMNIPLPSINRNVVLKANIIPYLGNRGLKLQRVKLMVNGSQIKRWKVEKAGEYSAVIPKQILSESRVVRIHFVLPDAVSPKKAEGISDDRELALAFLNMKIEETNNAHE